MAAEISKLLMISFILVLLAYLFFIIGFSTTYHTTIDSSLSGTVFKVHGGLWRKCITITGATTCSDIEGTVVDKGLYCLLIANGLTPLSAVLHLYGGGQFFWRRDKDWFRTCRAFSVIALITFLAAAICTGLKLLVLKESKPILIAAIATTFASSFCILLSDILLTQNIDDFTVNGVKADYGWSFALTLVGMCIAVIAGVIMIVDLVKGNSNGKVNSKDGEK